MDAEHGTLRQSEIEQLREFLAQEVDFTVLVNKIDKKQTDAEAILSHIREQVQQAFDKPAPVCAVSAASDDVAAFRDTLAAIDFDHALRAFWRRRVVRLVDDAIESLHTRYSALNISTAESERVIEDLESKEEALKEKLRQDERDIRHRYSARAVDRIVRAVRDAIGEAAPSLADAYLQGGRDAGDRELNELVRHTLNRVLAEEQAGTMQRIVEHYRTDIDEINAEYDRFANRQLSDDSGPLIDVGAKIVEMLERVIPHPIVRRVLTILVGIIRAIVSLFSSSSDQAQQQERQRRDLPMHIRSVVAPRIAAELRPAIESHYAKVAQQMLSNLRQQVKAKIERVRADINKSQAEIATKEEGLQSSKDVLRTAVDRLTTLKSPLEDGP